jgi:hypothetical protein
MSTHRHSSLQCKPKPPSRLVHELDGRPAHGHSSRVQARVRAGQCSVNFPSHTLAGCAAGGVLACALRLSFALCVWLVGVVTSSCQRGQVGVPLSVASGL